MGIEFIFGRIFKLIGLILFVVLCSLAGIQILYLIVLLCGVLKKDRHQVQPPHPVSVIVCAHDEEANLRELIPMLLAQEHPQFEVIIVEDRCNDGTFDYLREATEKDARLRMVRVIHKPENINGKKFGLTLGIKAAQYEWLVFTDADCRPSSNRWLNHMSEKQNESTQFVLGFSAYAKAPGLLNAFIRFETLLTGILYSAFARLGKPYMGVGRNLSYTKSLFLNSKGFHAHQEITGGDDDLLVNRLATRKNAAVVLGPEAITISKPKITWSDFLHQKLRHLSVGRYYKFSDKIMLSLFTGSWVAFLLLSPLGYFTPFVWVIGAIFLVRWFFLLLLFGKAARRLGAEIELWKIPVLDVTFAFYYLVTGLRALVVKRIKWKKN